MVKEELIPLKSDLDRVFKPIFDQYPEDGGVPLNVLRDELIKLGATENIPRAKIDLLVQKADEDRDGMLDYSEFVKLMTESDEPILTPQQLSRFQRMLRVAVSSVVPPNARNRQGKVVVDDYVEQYNCKPPPLFMPIISIVELAIFIYYVFDLKKHNIEVNARSGVPVYSPLIYNPCRRYEAWRYVSYMFIHQGYIHIISNLIFQLVLGIPLEIVHKAWRIGIVYTCGVIAGCLCHSVFDINVFLAGASGGCYAMIGAHLANIVMNWSEMTTGMTESVVRFIFSAPVQLTFWILFASIDFGFAVYQRYQGVGTNVGYAAHLGGAIVGLLIGIPVLKNIDVKPWEKIIFWIALIIYLLFVIAAVLFNLFYPNYPKPNSC